MTIQNWTLAPGRAVVVCDSLVTDVDTDEPTNFMSKVWLVPHLSMMVAVKNWAHPALALYMELLGLGHIQSPDDLLQFAPALLRGAAASQERHAHHAAECLVVVFGFDFAQSCVFGIQFDGRHGFAPQVLGETEMLMPNAPGLPTDDWERGLAQQAYDLGLPPDDRDNIGGPLICAALVANGAEPLLFVRRLGVLPEWRADRLGQHVGAKP